MKRLLLLVISVLLVATCVSCLPDIPAPYPESSDKEVDTESSPAESSETEPPETESGETEPPETEESKSDEVTVDGVALSEYIVVYKSSDQVGQRLAYIVADAMEAVLGERPKTKTDTFAYTSGKEILCGVSKRVEGELLEKVNGLKSGGYVMCTEGDFLFLGGKDGDYKALLAAVNDFVSIITDAETSGKYAVSLDGVEKAAKEPGHYTVMSYNDGGNAVTKVEQISRIVQDYKPDLIGFQEFQYVHYSSHYQNVLSEYGMIYYENDGTAYNSQPIFYLKEKFEVVDSGRQWLSRTPDKEYTKLSDSAYIRSYTYAVLRDKETGLEFVMINTHIDYNVIPQQTSVLLELTERFWDLPVLYTGDFNMSDRNEGYKDIVAAGYIPSYLTDIDAKIEATTVGGEQTIDYCFIDHKRIVCNEYKVINDHQYSKTASDHYPILSDISIMS